MLNKAIITRNKDKDKTHTYKWLPLSIIKNCWIMTLKAIHIKSQVKQIRKKMNIIIKILF